MAYSSSSVSVPSSAQPGTSVSGSVYVQNLYSSTITFRVGFAASFPGGSLTNQYQNVNLGAGASTRLYFSSFVMPGSNVSISVYVMWLGTDGSYHVDAQHSPTIYVSSPPAFNFAGRFVSLDSNLLRYNYNTGVWSTSIPQISAGQIIPIKVDVQNQSIESCIPRIKYVLNGPGASTPQQIVTGVTTLAGNTATIIVYPTTPTSWSQGSCEIACYLYMIRTSTSVESGLLDSKSYNLAYIQAEATPQVTNPIITSVSRI
jgi:hypothetical protein